MIPTARDMITAAAHEHGWTLANTDDFTGEHKYTRRNPSDRRKTESITVRYNLRGDVVRAASWMPASDGVGGREFDTQKRNRVIAQMAANGQYKRS